MAMEGGSVIHHGRDEEARLFLGFCVSLVKVIFFKDDDAATTIVSKATIVVCFENTYFPPVTR